MLSKKNFSISGLVLKIIVAWALIAFVVYPVLSLLVQTFWQGGSLSTDVFGKVFSSARAMQSLKNSFILAFTLVVTVNVVGTLCVLFTEYWDIKGAKILRLSYCLRGKRPFDKTSSSVFPEYEPELVRGLRYGSFCYFKSISDHFTHNDLIFRIYVEFDEMSVLKPLYTTVESFGLQVLDTILNNPRNTGNYNAILSIKNPEDRAHEQVAEYLKKIQGVRKVKLIY